jgi:putative FmdB family regulatory protein
MPLYEYRCRVCGATLDVLVRGSQAITCPHCGSAALDKLILQRKVALLRKVEHDYEILRLRRRNGR